MLHVLYGRRSAAKYDFQLLTYDIASSKLKKKKTFVVCFLFCFFYIDIPKSLKDKVCNVH